MPPEAYGRAYGFERATDNLGAIDGPLVASLAPAHLRGSAFGLLAVIQSLGNLGASVIAGLLWTTVSPWAAFVFLAAAMLAAVPLIGAGGRGDRQ